MKQAFKTILTEGELRQIIREEVRAVITGEDNQIAGRGDEGFINISQAADYLKIKSGSIYNMVHKKSIPFHKSGKRVLFKKSELIAWMGEKK